MNGTVELEHCKTEDMHADVITKPLASEDHNKHAIHISGNEDKMIKKEGSSALALTLASRHNTSNK